MTVIGYFAAIFLVILVILGLLKIEEIIDETIEAHRKKGGEE